MTPSAGAATTGVTWLRPWTGYRPWSNERPSGDQLALALMIESVGLAGVLAGIFFLARTEQVIAEA